MPSTTPRTVGRPAARLRVTGPLTGELPVVPTTTGQHLAVTPELLRAAAAPLVTFVPTQRAPHGADLPHREKHPATGSTPSVATPTPPVVRAPTPEPAGPESRWAPEAVRALASHAVVEAVGPVTAPSPVVGVAVIRTPDRLDPLGPFVPVRPLHDVTVRREQPARTQPVAPSPVTSSPVTSSPVTPEPVHPEDPTATDTWPTRRSLRTVRSRAQRTARLALPGVAVASAFAAGYCGHLLLG